MIASTGARLDMPVTFEDEEIEILESYLECADSLLELEVVKQGVPWSYEMRIEEGRRTYVNVEIPSGTEMSALLHRLRPFILSDEPMSYLNVLAILGRRYDYDNMRQLLRDQRRLFDSRNNQEFAQITSNGVVINSEATLFQWLNAYEYHRDPKKKAHIQSLHRLLPLQESIPIFVGLIADKVQAILQLAGLLAVILGREQSIQVQRHGKPVE